MKNHLGKFVITMFVILAATTGVVLSSYMLSRFMLRIQQTTEKTIKVKGVAEVNVRSDLAAFSCTLSVKAKTREEGLKLINSQKEVLQARLKELGFTEDMFEDETLNHFERYRTIRIKPTGKSNSEYEELFGESVVGKEVTEEVFDHYVFRYFIRIRTVNAELVSKNILKLYSLVEQKINIDLSTPEYYISNPEQYKLQLVDEASVSATSRAEVVASKCGSKLGKLLVARQGVIQITRPASNETSDYGVYDTGSLDKVMRLVMTLEFELE